MSKTKTTLVRILNKAFQVTCPNGQEEALYEAAVYLDKKMQEIRSHGRVIGLERIAVMAALNISHELLSHRAQKEKYVDSVTTEIERLQNKLDEVLMVETGEGESADDPESD